MVQPTIRRDDGVFNEVKTLFHLAWPSCVHGALIHSITTIQSALVGHVNDPTILPAFALTSVFTNVLGVSLLYGVASVCYTFIGQVHGAREFRAISVVFWRGIALTSLLALLLGTLFWNIEPLLVALRIPGDLRGPVALLCRWFAPSTLPQAWSFCALFALLAQGRMTHILCAGLVTMPLSVGVNVLFIRQWQWGIAGVGLARIAQELTMCVTLLLALLYSNWRRPAGERCLYPPCREALRGWGEYTLAAGPAVLMTILDWWAYEFIVFVASFLPNAAVETAVMGSCFQLHAIMFMLLMGLDNATTTRVANELGQSRPKAAKKALWIASALAAASMAVLAAPVAVWRQQVAQFFSHDPRVVQGMLACWPAMMASLVFGDAVNGVQSGGLRGCNQMQIGSAINFVVFWILGMPFCWYMAFRVGWGAVGLWTGMMCVGVTQAICQMVFVSLLDWREEGEKAARLVRSISSSMVSRPSAGQLLAISEETEPLLPEGCIPETIAL